MKASNKKEEASMRATLRLSAVRVPDWKLNEPEETLWSMNTSYSAAGSNIIHKLKKRPVCLVSLDQISERKKFEMDLGSMVAI